jgi:hypothetical protein
MAVRVIIIVSKVIEVTNMTKPFLEPEIDVQPVKGVDAVVMNPAAVEYATITI